jgi:hypothetical protein
MLSRSPKTARGHVFPGVKEQENVIEIEIEDNYNMYRAKPVAVYGPFQLCVSENI